MSIDEITGEKCCVKKTAKCLLCRGYIYIVEKGENERRKSKWAELDGRRGALGIRA